MAHKFRPIHLLGLSLFTLTGCFDSTPPPARTQVPPVGAPAAYHVEPERPLPPEAVAQLQGPGMPYEDEPLVVQETPEQPRFVAAYNAVGRPRIAVFVNRGLEGDAKGDGEAEAAIRRVDYDAVETILTDWLNCGGQVAIMSPSVVRQKLTAEQEKELSAKSVVPRQIAQTLDADVLVYVKLYATRQARDQAQIRLVAEALNIRDGQSIGRGVVDVPPPLDKITINRYTRFVARKLMDNMIGTWQAPPAGAGMPQPQPAATPAPVPAVPQTQPVQ